MKIKTVSDLMWYVAEVPMNQRNVSDFDVDGITVHHVTTTENAAMIRNSGFTARNSRQSCDRPDAVYFFVDIADITVENLGILGLNADYAMITVRIPIADFVQNVKWDGLFNATFSSYSAIQFLGNVPAAWIV